MLMLSVWSLSNTMFKAPKDQVSRAAKMLAEEYVRTVLTGYILIANFKNRVLLRTSNPVSIVNLSFQPLRRLSSGWSYTIKFRQTAWLSTVAKFWPLKGRKERLTSISSPSNQSIPPCISVTTNFIPRPLLNSWNLTRNLVSSLWTVTEHCSEL